jgi:MoaA/NifB/PqqE/SkfB family radical SAM enzyme
MTEKFLKKLKDYYVNVGYSLSRITNFPFVRPDFLQINLTTRCNLKCQICTTYKFSSEVAQELSAEEIKRIVLQASELGLNKIVFSGGEPFLRNDVFEMISFIKANTKMDVIITTNGTLIDEALAEKIVQSKINHLQISLDGATGKIHDSIRGDGSFIKTTEAIKILNRIRKESPSLGLSFTVTRLNYKEVLSFLDLGRTLGIDNILFIPFIEDNTYRHNKKITNKSIFTPKEVEEFNLILNEIGNFQKKYNRPAISNFNNLFLYAKYFSGTLNDLHWHCYAGFHWIQINPNGDMSMCEWGYGSIKGRSLKNAWYSPLAYSARLNIKQCRRLCLQPCMSRPS